MARPKIIVFGASGAVGRHVALEAHRLGGEVILASRNADKFIYPTAELPMFPQAMACVQADLGNPMSIKRVLNETGATIVFIYVVHGLDMRVTARALRQGGIQHVVLLSSFMVYPSIEVSMDEDANPISKVHAEAEMVLRDERLNVTALRPMYFARNIIRVLKDGMVRLYRGDSVDDYITAEDIGAVAAAKLVEEKGRGEVIPLCGPELISKREAWKIVGEVLGRDIQVVEVGREEYLKMTSETVVKHVEKDVNEKYPAELYAVAKGNVKKYTGREPLTLREWAEKHKEEFK